ncbi:hypothetical protein [Aquamicrobium terrae]
MMDRSLIDAAIAAGRVRHIPAGVSAFDPVTRNWWPTVEDAIAAFERSVEIAEAHLPAAPPKLRRQAKARNSHWATEETDATLRRLYTAGASYQEMGDAVGVNASVAHRRCKSLSLPDRKIRPGRPRKVRLA